MRDKKRIKPTLKVIEKIWEANPYLRLMQLLCNCFSVPSPPNEYYCEDDDLVVFLKQTYRDLWVIPKD